MPSCAHLHVHSEYSLLDGTARIEDLVERAAAFDQPALALTDHGVMNGAVELQQACKRHGIKPIQGCELYVATSRGHYPPGPPPRHHLTLLAENQTGFRNLMKLSSAGFLQGFQRGRPVVDAAMLANHAEGVIALTGCLQSRLCQALIDDDGAGARAAADDLLNIFGRDNVYLEIQQNGLAEQEKANDGVVRIARDVGRPLVGTADVHYLRREDYAAHQAWLCVQTKSTLAEPKMTFATNELYLRSSAMMAAAFAAWPEALASTLEIADRCDVEIELRRPLIPRFDCPNGMGEREYLRELVFNGLAWRYGEPILAAARERAEFELAVIDKMGFTAYFLIVCDYVRYARQHRLAVGPGRGSAAGSIVNHCLGITDPDPLRHDLLFERFLRPDTAVPDIDIDFSVRGREQLIKYVTNKYGNESVAQVVTFSKMFPRSAAREAARVLDYADAMGDKVVKLIPDPRFGRPLLFADCLAPGQPLRAEVERDARSNRIVEVARGMERILRNKSIHAAAIVIADRPLTNSVPLQLVQSYASDDSVEPTHRTVTQFSMKSVEAVGLLKMDLLGLRNLDEIEDALDIIERSTGERPDMASLRLDDPTTYGLLARGESTGVFQFDSEAMREALRTVRPTEFDDIVALVALHRPGATDQIPAYARGKRDPNSVTYADERLRPILTSTKGVIVYQEQQMQIAKTLAGFSGPDADDLRREFGKKNREALARMRVEFEAGCLASETAEEAIDEIWRRMYVSSDFAFNRSHATCYALIAYRTAWLAANFPAEYLAARNPRAAT